MRSALVVDDTRLIRRIARGILEECGFSCREAENGRQALERCQEQMPDLVLLDWEMPEMTGIEFIAALRASPGGDGPKVIFCTTHNDADHIMRALADGSDEYVMKPFDREIILDKLRTVGLAD